MENCYTLLGISPGATSEEIEAAYQDKKRAPCLGEEALKELNRAYDEAIMATFAPIKAFAVPSVKPPSELDGLVEEGAMPADEHLQEMDIGQLRDTYGYNVKEPVISTWGIRDRLLRYYVKSYAAFVVLELFMAFTLGSALLDYTNALAGHNARELQRVVDVVSRLKGSEEIVRETQGTIEQMQAAAIVPPSTLELVLKSFITTAYYFLCALPIPIVMRFFIMGQPPEAGTTRWMLSSVAACAALALHTLVGGLFGKWAGSGITLAFVTVMLSNTTLKYAGASDS